VPTSDCIEPAVLTVAGAVKLLVGASVLAFSEPQATVSASAEPKEPRNIRYLFMVSATFVGRRADLRLASFEQLCQRSRIPVHSQNVVQRNPRLSEEASDYLTRTLPIQKYDLALLAWGAGRTVNQDSGQM